MSLHVFGFDWFVSVNHVVALWSCCSDDVTMLNLSRFYFTKGVIFDVPCFPVEFLLLP